MKQNKKMKYSLIFFVIHTNKPMRVSSFVTSDQVCLKLSCSLLIGRNSTLFLLIMLSAPQVIVMTINKLFYVYIILRTFTCCLICCTS